MTGGRHRSPGQRWRSQAHERAALMRRVKSPGMGADALARAVAYRGRHARPEPEDVTS